MANKPDEANFFPDVPQFPSMGTFQPVYGKFDLTTYIQGASDYEIMAFLVGKYNACLEAYGTITKLSTDTMTACKQLQDWINSWFDNLDVQEELNNKIDSMVQDGSFGRLLHQNFDAQINQQTTSAVTAWLVANVTPAGSAVVVDKSLSIEGAAADAKETGKLKEDLNSYFSSAKSINLLNIHDNERWLPGKVANTSAINAGVTPIDNPSYNVYKLDCAQGEQYFVAEGDSIYTKNRSGFRFICFTDASNRLIADRVNGEDTSVVRGQFTVPNGTVYAYITLYAKNANPMIIKGTIGNTYYIAYSAYDSTASFNDEYIKLVPGKNLLDETKSVDGFQKTGIIETTSTLYKLSDFIPVKAGEVYTISPRARFVSYANINKNLLSFDGAEPITKASPTVDGYIRVTYYKTDAGKIQVEAGSFASEYEPFRMFMPESFGLLNAKQMEDVLGRIDVSSSDVLKGKKWVVLGDSFTAGGTSDGAGKITDGRYAGENYTYPWLIGNRCDMEIVRFFTGGRTLGYPSDGSFTNSITCPTSTAYYQKIPADADYITFYIGINDSNHINGTGVTPDGEDATGVIGLGTVDSAGTDTFGGAWNTVLAWLRQNRPFAHVGIIVTNGASRDHELLTISCAKKYGYPYINLNGDERTSAMFRTTNPDIPSNVKSALYNAQVIPGDSHPNDATHLFESKIIEAWLRTI